MTYLLLPYGNPLEDVMVDVIKGCRTVFKEKPPQKKEDPGWFNIPVTIKEFYLGEVMCDLVSSANMMSLSLFKKI